MKHLKGFIDNITPISDEAWKDLKALLKERTVVTGEHICDFKDIPEYCYFIKSGVLRAYTITSKGTEHNTSLFSSFHLTGSLSALILNKPSKIAYQALTKCHIIEGNYSAILDLCYKHQELSRFLQTMLEYFYISLESRTIELATLNAKERYLNLMKRIPDIEKLIPQYHIASHIGITPIQLSRIKKDMKDVVKNE
jgi:CRP-like cAMP-binding protein